MSSLPDIPKNHGHAPVASNTMSTAALGKIIELLRQGQLASRYSGLVDVRRHAEGGLALLNLQCRTPTVYPFDNLTEVLESRRELPAHREGYVVRSASGLRVKVKGEAYLTLHELAAGLSERAILEALATGTAEQLLHRVPEEFRGEVERKTFALWVQTHVPVELRGVLFQLLDQKAPSWYGVLLARGGRDYAGNDRRITR